MLAVLLVGFQYTGDKLLEGINLDLYRMWTFCRQSTEDITILTDIAQDPQMDASILLDRRYPVGGQAITFIADREQDQSLRRVPQIDSLPTFTQYLEEWSSEHPTKNLLVYFTGHGVREGSIRLPDRTLFDARKFRDQILHRLLPTGQLVWLWDACFPCPLDLPYKWSRQRKIWKRSGDLRSLPSFQMLCLTSNSENRPSLAGKRGSLWSNVLFAYALQHKTIAKFFTVLVDKMREKVSNRYCHPTLWSSDPFLTALPFPLNVPTLPELVADV